MTKSTNLEIMIEIFMDSVCSRLFYSSRTDSFFDVLLAKQRFNSPTELFVRLH